MDKEQALKRVEDLKGYYGHLAAYVATNAFLIVLNLITSPEYLWFLYCLLGWGIGIFIHTVQIFGIGADWEARKLEELTGLKDTRDEVQRLAERTDALVTILASVDWERIDPELVHTRDALDAARAQLSELREHADPDRQLEVAREIERLEAFVTSSKFDYLEAASRSH